jgi:thioredoxin reductase
MLNRLAAIVLRGCRTADHQGRLVHDDIVASEIMTGTLDRPCWELATAHDRAPVVAPARLRSRHREDSGGVRHEYQPVDKLKQINLATESTVAIVTESGETHELDALYPALGCTVRSDLATALGALCTENGNLVFDDHQRTTVDGLYAAGDVVTDLHQLSVAFGHAAIAATDIHNRLAPNLR